MALANPVFDTGTSRQSAESYSTSAFRAMASPETVLEGA